MSYRIFIYVPAGLLLLAVVLYSVFWRVQADTLSARLDRANGGEVIERHLILIGFMAKPEPDENDAQRAAAAEAGAEGAAVRTCPRCSAAGLVKLEGCDTCMSCGYSKCA